MEKYQIAEQKVDSGRGDVAAEFCYENEKNCVVELKIRAEN
jgi:hypothetical protein